ncbi:GNAT family N-acetyltransferase [Phenylobacterium sp.]|uniref:GNAT family N-acetyltransferase n=1 Tax=Phenylobacterium sp. TaxID=1871053 RepID=UPI0030016F86
MSPDTRLDVLTAEQARPHLPALGELLAACVAQGASVSFLAGLEAPRATDWWAGQLDADDGRRLITAFDRQGLCGVVQVIPAGPENQPHRADVAKMLVLPRARRTGLGAALLEGAEAAARQMGLTLLVFDTVTGGDAERLYARAGWSRVGVIPDFALSTDGRPEATTVFYKALAR